MGTMMVDVDDNDDDVDDDYSNFILSITSLYT